MQRRRVSWAEELTSIVEYEPVVHLRDVRLQGLNSDIFRPDFAMRLPAYVTQRVRSALRIQNRKFVICPVRLLRDMDDIRIVLIMENHEGEKMHSRITSDGVVLPSERTCTFDFLRLIGALECCDQSSLFASSVCMYHLDVLTSIQLASLCSKDASASNQDVFATCHKDQAGPIRNAFSLPSGKCVSR